MRNIFIFLLFASHVCGEENFLLVRAATNERLSEFGPRVHMRSTPACSFNIALSLMAYDAGVLKDLDTPVWDYQEGYLDWIDSWKASQTPQTWIQRSCVWYSQLIAGKLGFEGLHAYLRLFDYGNQDMSGGLLRPWVSATLKISPQEQVAFVQKLVQGKLPVSEHAIQMTRGLLFKEELSGGWMLYGKTGLATDEGLKIGWFVGWVERGDDAYIFAYNIREPKVNPAPMVPRVKDLLQQNIYD